VFRVYRMFESLLEMDESAGGLNQPFEEIRITRICFEPKLLEHIVCLIITLLVPALKKGAIKWMLCDIRSVWIDIFSSQLGHQPRNPLAFVHEGFNLLAAQIMSKPARISFLGETWPRLPACELSQPEWLCHHRR